MSMNLSCNGFDVIQTPTYITYLIYDDAAGGMNAVKRRYINYIKYLRQTQFNANPEKPSLQKEVWDNWTEHIKACEKSGPLTFAIV